MSSHGEERARRYCRHQQHEEVEEEYKHYLISDKRQFYTKYDLVCKQ